MWLFIFNDGTISPNSEGNVAYADSDICERGVGVQGLHLFVKKGGGIFTIWVSIFQRGGGRIPLIFPLDQRMCWAWMNRLPALMQTFPDPPVVTVQHLSPALEHWVSSVHVGSEPFNPVAGTVSGHSTDKNMYSDIQ